jgi:hypothetical protein
MNIVSTLMKDSYFYTNQYNNDLEYAFVQSTLNLAVKI